MKQLTAKQRAGIYRKAAEDIFNSRGCLNAACVSICHAADMIWVFTPKKTLKKIFSEFFLFEPEYYPGLWWGENDSPRILALLFAEQIALDSKS